MANLLDPRALDTQEITGATLPVATSSNLLPREMTTAVTAEQGTTGETVNVPKADWLRVLQVAGLALRDVGSSLQGKPTNFLMEQLVNEENLAQRKAAGQRAERATTLAEQAGQRAEHGLQREDRAQFLNELLTIGPRLYTASEADRNKAIGALEQRASQFDLVPLVRGVTGNANTAKLAGEYGPLLQKYGTEGIGLAANQLFAKGDAAGALKLIEDHMKPYAMTEARDSVRNVIGNLTVGGKPPSYAEVLAAVKANNPLYSRTIEQNPDFFSGEFALRGIRTPKVAEIGAEALAKADAKPPERMSRDLMDVLKGEPFRLEDPSTATPAQVTAARKMLQGEKVEVAAAQGKAGAEARLSVPEKASGKERELLAEESSTLENINMLSSLYNPDFVGPIAGRASGVGERVGAISTPNAEFRASVAQFRNKIIKQITGAQMSEQEATRIREQLPETTNPPAVFEARLRQTAGNIEVLARRRREILTQTGVDVSHLPPLPKMTLPGKIGNDLSSLSDAELKKRLGIE